MRSDICPVAWAERRQQKHRRWRRKSFRVIVEKVISAKIIVFVYKKGFLYKKFVFIPLTWGENSFCFIYKNFLLVDFLASGIKLFHVRRVIDAYLVNSMKI
jgi:hypothetical protein